MLLSLQFATSCPRLEPVGMDRGGRFASAQQQSMAQLTKLHESLLEARETRGESIDRELSLESHRVASRATPRIEF